VFDPSSATLLARYLLFVERVPLSMAIEGVAAGIAGSESRPGQGAVPGHARWRKLAAGAGDLDRYLDVLLRETGSR